jgi:hypothetical protein
MCAAVVYMPSNPDVCQAGISGYFICQEDIGGLDVPVRM